MRIDEDKVPDVWPAGRPVLGVDLPRPFPPMADEDLAKLARAMAHPARIRIVRALHKKGDLAVWEIMREVPLAQSTVSAHLRTLRRAGIVTKCPYPPTMVYAIDREVLRRLRRLLAYL